MHHKCIGLWGGGGGRGQTAPPASFNKWSSHLQGTSVINVGGGGGAEPRYATDTHTHTHTHIHTRTYTCTHTCSHTLLSNTNTHIHTYTHHHQQQQQQQQQQAVDPSLLHLLITKFQDLMHMKKKINELCVAGRRPFCKNS